MGYVSTERRSGFYFEVIPADMRDAYLSDARPWIVGFSGGKDSTMVVQFVYYMLANLPPGDRQKQVYVLASDTRVETPAISGRIRRELDSLAAAAERDKLPISTHIVYPKLNDTFWVNLIGRGYPSPTALFRWCTDRLRIRPVSEFIRNAVSRSGSVVVVLGARRQESATRARAMRARVIENQRFRPHTDLSNAWVYTPIEAVTTNDVWLYLLQAPSPRGGRQPRSGHPVQTRRRRRMPPRHRHVHAVLCPQPVWLLDMHGGGKRPLTGGPS